MSASKEIKDVMHRIISDMENNVVIDPAKVANMALSELDPGSKENKIRMWAEYQQFRKMAGEVCTRLFDPVARVNDLNDEQLVLFGNTMQTHYAIEINGKKVCKRADCMTDEEFINWPIKRMSKAADGLNQHIDTILAYMQLRKASSDDG